jgi:hypothetical protein
VNQFTPVQTSADFTDRDLSRYMGTVAGKGGIRVQFFYQRVEIENVDPTKGGQVENRLCVRKVPMGDRYTVAVSEITPAEAQQKYPREYAMFMQYEDVPTDGTPLSELPGITQSDIAMLTIYGLRCVEDMRELSADQIAQIGMDASRVQKLALAWLAKRDGSAEQISNADLAARLERALQAAEDRAAKQEEEIRTLRAMVTMGAQQGGNKPVSDQPIGIDSTKGAVMADIDQDDGFMAGGGVVIDNSDLADPLAG